MRQPAQIVLVVFDLLSLSVVFALESDHPMRREQRDTDSESKRQNHHLHEKVVKDFLAVFELLPFSLQYFTVEIRHLLGQADYSFAPRQHAARQECPAAV